MWCSLSHDEFNLLFIHDNSNDNVLLLFYYYEFYNNYQLNQDNC